MACCWPVPRTAAREPLRRVAARIPAALPAAPIDTRLLEDGWTPFTTVAAADDDPDLIVIDALVVCAEYTFEAVPPPTSCRR